MQNGEYKNILDIGYKLGSYEILDKLGEGGFGITYKARHIHLETIVVIKEYMPVSIAVRDRDSISITVTNQGNIEDYQFGLERFLSEAKILASFKHPNIVGINDFFEANNTAYFVMPFVDGITLGDFVEEMVEEVTQEQLLNLMVPILEGLRETHSQGILHRDIKPDNIFLTKNGTPILIDFGAARIDFARKSESINAVLTPPYAPSEQYGSSAMQGPWTDIYALGMVLYKLITNLDSADIPPSIDRVTTVYSGSVDPLAPMDSPNYSDEFKKLILKALAINPKDRFQSAVEMIEAFIELDKNSSSIKEDIPKLIENKIKEPQNEQTIVRNEPIEELNIPIEKKKRKGIIAIGVFTLLFASAGAFCMLSGSCSKEKKNSTIAKKSEEHNITEVSKAVQIPADKAFEDAKKLLDSGAIDEAKEYFEIASNQGHIKAKVYLGQIAEAKKNFKDAKKYYYESAKADDVEGQFFYAEMMKIDNNLPKAKYWYTKSALQGHLKAKFMLGEIAFVNDEYGDAQKYYEEVLNDRDLLINNSIQTTKTITKKNQNTIKLNLTYIYFKIDKNNTKAKNMVPKDISMGQAYFAQILLDEGDRKEAKRWMKKSADNGYQPAKDFLKDNF
jgi:serine/threonine protein kinase